MESVSMRYLQNIGSKSSDLAARPSTTLVKKVDMVMCLSNSFQDNQLYLTLKN